MLLAQAEGRNELITPAHLPESLEDFALVTRFVFEAATKLGVPPQDTAWFVDRLLTLLTSCDERRLGQWELQSWWRFVDADRRSPAFQKFLADGLTRTLVAAKAHEMSARTGGSILLQLLFDLTRAGGRADRVLDGPTSDVWIDPWAAHLEALGVEFRRGAPVQGIQMAGGRVTGATVGGETVTADHYVAAVPVEVMRLLASPELRAAEPRLKRLDKLVTRWMNGVMFYLRRGRADGQRPRDLHRLRVGADLDLAAPVLARRSTSARSATGSVGGILSVDVSDWTTAEPADWQDRHAVQPRGDPRRGVGAAAATTSRTGSTTATSCPRSSTPRSSSRTPRRPPTSSRCWSTPPARGPTGPTR